MLNGMDIKTGIDLDKLMQTSKYISDAINRPIGSRVTRAFQAKCNNIPTKE